MCQSLDMSADTLSCNNQDATFRQYVCWKKKNQKVHIFLKNKTEVARYIQCS